MLFHANVYLKFFQLFTTINILITKIGIFELVINFYFSDKHFIIPNN